MTTNLNLSIRAKAPWEKSFEYQMVNRFFSTYRLYLIGNKKMKANQVKSLNPKWWNADTTKLKKADLIFKNEKTFKQILNVLTVWETIQKLKIEKPVMPEEIFRTLSNATLEQKKVNLFVPWGVKPSFKKEMYKDNIFIANSPEDLVVKNLFKFQATLKEQNIQSTLMFMPADLYATKVNSVDPKTSNDYFSILKNSIVSNPNAIVKPWSEIRCENAERYRELSEKYSKKEIKNYVSWALVQKAFSSAKKFSDKKDYKTSAFAYITERLAEADIIKEVYNPIKLSCVDPIKDGVLDRGLLRLYIMKEDLRFPWLRSLEQRSI